MLDDLHNAVGTDYRVMHYLRAPAVAVLNAVAIYSVTRHILTHENTIMDDERVVGVDSRSSRTGSGSRNSRVKASATRKGKEYYSHTQCQGESR